ncbi:hypothetical protein BD310DRAFT_936611, partial [Dichomitus squalens]
MVTVHEYGGRVRAAPARGLRPASLACLTCTASCLTLPIACSANTTSIESWADPSAAAAKGGKELGGRASLSLSSWDKTDHPRASKDDVGYIGRHRLACTVYGRRRKGRRRYTAWRALRASIVAGQASCIRRPLRPGSGATRALGPWTRPADRRRSQL